MDVPNKPFGGADQGATLYSGYPYSVLGGQDHTFPLDPRLALHEAFPGGGPGTVPPPPCLPSGQPHQGHSSHPSQCPYGCQISKAGIFAGFRIAVVEEGFQEGVVGFLVDVLQSHSADIFPYQEGLPRDQVNFILVCTLYGGTSSSWPTDATKGEWHCTGIPLVDKTWVQACLQKNLVLSPPVLYGVEEDISLDLSLESAPETGPPSPASLSPRNVLLAIEHGWAPDSSIPIPPPLPQMRDTLRPEDIPPPPKLPGRDPPLRRKAKAIASARKRRGKADGDGTKAPRARLRYRPAHDTAAAPALLERDTERMNHILWSAQFEYPWFAPVDMAGKRPSRTGFYSFYQTRYNAPPIVEKCRYYTDWLSARCSGFAKHARTSRGSKRPYVLPRTRRGCRRGARQSESEYEEGSEEEDTEDEESGEEEAVSEPADEAPSPGDDRPNSRCWSGSLTPLESSTSSSAASHARPVPTWQQAAATNMPPPDHIPQNRYSTAPHLQPEPGHSHAGVPAAAGHLPAHPSLHGFDALIAAIDTHRGPLRRR